MTHEPTFTKRMKGVHLRYSYRNWSDAFICPHCGNSRRFSLNFLGNRRIPRCDGARIVSGPTMTWEEYDAARQQQRA